MAIWDSWERGYPASDLRTAEERFGFRFPPDLFDFLTERRIPGGHDWTNGGDADRIFAALRWPLEGILFDVEEDALWWPEWGERPTDPDQRAAVVRELVGRAPTLIPLFLHRYLPALPYAAGNPVFSVHQSDIIHYGLDLYHYLSCEFGEQWPVESARPRRIDFWSTMVDRNCDPAW